ncbi:MAG: outer membrane lipoprotein carrier protein LolA [Rhodospirillales bacterium]|nr:outer membrane lipoprotein carrier protein LolA [Rhodospirillales bacterium]MCB9996128.1 outer membrane lipoprotein carrier protein LolA [Rhodospirillales bacterium]
MRMKYFVLIIGFLTFAQIGSYAAQAQSPRLPATAQKAQDYLNSLSTAKARFLQTSADGRQLTGTFYLDRPGRLRFEYDPPIEDFIVADGFLVYFYDAELGEQSNAPIGQTMADFILREKLSMTDGLTITGIKNSADLLQITLVQEDDPDAGSITLGLTQNPMALKKWRITDSTGAITEIELFQLETGIELASNLFIYVDPKRFAEPRYND